MQWPINHPLDRLKVRSQCPTTALPAKGLTGDLRIDPLLAGDSSGSSVPDRAKMKPTQPNSGVSGCACPSPFSQTSSATWFPSHGADPPTVQTSPSQRNGIQSDTKTAQAGARKDASAIHHDKRYLNLDFALCWADPTCNQSFTGGTLYENRKSLP